ncbi:hypothetical protein MFIFM68171_07923 [Madurella fahalii]|uniref:Uncharacterized protein n=1 Tax=Madurella fahalii TaxID=1157608 RepID=A0ABQ0GIX6_9PEZI
MRTKHNFNPTARQYKHHFPRLKNVTGEEWAYIDDECQRRAALGKQTVVCLHGQPLPPERVNRGIARTRTDSSKYRIAKRASQASNLKQQNSYAARISFKTLSPAIVGGESSGPLPSNNRGESRIEPNVVLRVFDLPALQAQPSPVSESPFRQAHEDLRIPLVAQTLGDGLPVEPVMGDPWFDLDGAIDLESSQGFIELGDVNMDIGFTSGNGIIATSGMHTNNSPPFQTVAVPGIGRRASSHLHPGSPSVGAILFPSGEPVNFNVFGTTCGRGLTRNLPYFQLLSAIEQPGYPLPGHPSPAELQSAGVAEITSQLQQLIPERYDGDLLEKLERILDPSSSAPATLPMVFALVAFFASNNDLGPIQMDKFLTWTIRQGYADALARFMEIQTSTVHAFARAVLESAIRIKSVQVLDALVNCGVKLDSMLYRIALIGDTGLTRRILFNSNPVSFAWRPMAADLLHHFIYKRQYDMAQFLLDNRVSADATSNGVTALYWAVERKDIAGIKFLLAAGANVNAQGYIGGTFDRVSIAPLALALSLQYAEVAVLLLEHGAHLTSKIEGKPILELAALYRRSMFELLKERLGTRERESLLAGVVEPGAGGFVLADVVDAANRGSHALAAYITGRWEVVTAPQLEQALGKSIRDGKLMATMALLQHGVNPNGPTLTICPLAIALQRDRIDHGFLNSFLNTKQTMKALVVAAEAGDILSIAMLLDSGLDIDTPGLELNPLQTVSTTYIYNARTMAVFLIRKGANVNAPAYPKGGRTALQISLESEGSPDITDILLDYGADASAPPALLDGVTALEAFCHGSYSSDELKLIDRLLDAGATVNRPGGKPSSALHGLSSTDGTTFWAASLSPSTMSLLITCASRGKIVAVRMLLDHGADVNEAPGYKYGRTALQAAALLKPGPAKMTLIHLLLDRGANINADAAVQCGVTALQGAAVAGDLTLAELLIGRGADVNAWPSFENGYTAIEAAAKHGRLDMVQLLLNAGAKGDVIDQDSFYTAIVQAECSGYFAIANLLKKEQARFEARVGR